MKTEKAEKFNSLLGDAIDAFNKFQKRRKGNLPITEVEKEKYSPVSFKSNFNAFIDELKENIHTYKDIYIVRDYVDSKFYDLNFFSGYDYNQIKEIIDADYEVEFLIKLQKDIEHYTTEIDACSITNYDKISFVTTLRYYFDTEMSPKLPHSEDLNTIEEEPEYELEKRFVFNELKSECDKLTQAVDKINLITDRLFDLEQWQLQCDTLIQDKDLGNYYELTAKYYPKFEDLCAIELRRINKMIEIENRINSKTTTITEQTPSPYKWNSTDTDFLELFAALFQNESIVRTDAKPLTRKEMLEYFQSILGLEIKDAEVKLNRAGNRNDNTAFMDALAQGFRNFVASKEKKQAKRK